MAPAMERSGLWQELSTDWVALDCELMPWSAKAQELLRQNAAVGAASRAALGDAVDRLDQAARRGAEAEGLLARFRDLKLAPFHLLASEGAVYTEKDHLWHMQTLARLCQGGPGPAPGDPASGGRGGR